MNLFQIPRYFVLGFKNLDTLKYKYLDLGTSSQNTKKGVDVRSMLKNLAIGFIRNSGQI